MIDADNGSHHFSPCYSKRHYQNCDKCGEKMRFPNIGYGKHGREMEVCDNCLESLKFSYPEYYEEQE